MVTSDYGKIAYLKIVELEKKVKDLEKKVSQSTYTELEYFYSDLISKYTHEFYINLTALKEGTAYLKLFIDGDFEAGAYSIEVKVNGVHFFMENVPKTNQKTISLNANLNKGENEIAVIIFNDIELLRLNSLKVNVSGYVEYLKIKNNLSNACLSGVEYVLQFKKDVATLFLYSQQDGLVNSYTLTDIKDCKIAGGISNVLYLPFIDQNNNLFMCEYNIETGSDNVIDLKVSACSSVAGYPCENGVKIFYSKFAKIFSGVYESGKPFLPSYTGRKGLEVYADASAPKAIVIVDNFLNAKFVTE